MHRIVNKTKTGIVTDHINGNGLDNRKKNLRSVTHAENIQHRTRLNKDNTSGIANVYFYTSRKKWCSQITKNKRKFFLGYFKTKLTAKRALNKFKQTI